MNDPESPILVVEDVSHIRELLEVTLKFKGYPVVSAQNGEEALERIRDKTPALVIADILMPRLDGFALAQRLRSQDDTRNLPIILLSATYITPEDRDFAMRLGAVKFIEKPVDTEDFLLTVAEILTQGPPDLPAPLDQDVFNEEYRQRLEEKLRHKSNQVSRIERLLKDLPDTQKPVFIELLSEARLQREQIQAELDKIYAQPGGR
ncbi:MAG TPA: response regulator [Anaerolineales bacterium]|nr:response regulator [Anaerolineales bacterium]